MEEIREAHNLLDHHFVSHFGKSRAKSGYLRRATAFRCSHQGLTAGRNHGIGLHVIVIQPGAKLAV